MTLNETTRKELDLRLDAIEEAFNSDRRGDRTMATIAFALLLNEVQPAIESFAFLDEENFELGSRIKSTYELIR